MLIMVKKSFWLSTKMLVRGKSSSYLLDLPSIVLNKLSKVCANTFGSMTTVLKSGAHLCIFNMEKDSL